MERAHVRAKLAALRQSYPKWSHQSLLNKIWPNRPIGASADEMICKILYSSLQTVSDWTRSRLLDCSSVRAFAVKPRAFGAPLRGCGA
jgi:hypothetical protein